MSFPPCSGPFPRAYHALACRRASRLCPTDNSFHCLHSAQKQTPRQIALPAAVIVAAGAALANPLVAEAASVTPSLKNFVYSLIAGGVVLGGIAGALTGAQAVMPF